MSIDNKLVTNQPTPSPQPLINWSTTDHQPIANHSSTDYQLITNQSPTTRQMINNWSPTNRQPLVNLLPTDHQPVSNHSSNDQKLITNQSPTNHRLVACSDQTFRPAHILFALVTSRLATYVSFVVVASGRKPSVTGARVRQVVLLLPSHWLIERYSRPQIRSVTG